LEFTDTLLQWYHTWKRDLPWRETGDPYRIWLSEIILQQTRIGQGLPYYEKFVQAYPDIGSLAQAPEEDVLKLWQGLGYYSRARNMHKAAQVVMQLFGGVFPNTRETILGLPGIGDYTAAAIGSIAFRLPDPVVDGNVLRFFCRYFGIHDPVSSEKTRKEVRARAGKLISLSDPGSFNQAMMEFGAIQCVPVAPVCSQCPFRQSCYASLHGLTNVLPVRSGTIKKRLRYFNYLVIRSNDGLGLIVKKRDTRDIWRGLYDFPLIETEEPVSGEALKSTSGWKEIEKMGPCSGVHSSETVRHMLTHQVILATFFELSAHFSSSLPDGWRWAADFKKLAIPRLIEKYLRQNQRFF